MRYRIWVVAFIVILAIFLLFLRGKVKYYSQIFSDNHYAEIGNWLHSVLAVAPKPAGNPPESSALQTSAECGLVFTREIAEKDVLHISISQVDNHTTHAVSSRLAALILQILKANKFEADLFYTDSGIHHVVLSKEVVGDWLVADVGEAVAAMKSSKTLPFRYQSLGGEPIVPMHPTVLQKAEHRE
jgi:hypothetical protein